MLTTLLTVYRYSNLVDTLTGESPFDAVVSKPFDFQALRNALEGEEE